MSYRKFKPFEVPRTWHFKDPDTGLEFSDDDLNSLQKKINQFRDQNQLEVIPSLQSVIENYTASKPEYNHLTESIPLKRGWKSYIKGGVVLFKNLFFGNSNMVSDVVADRRAAICRLCPLNVFPDKEGFLKWSDDIAADCTNGRKSKYHEELGNCAGCTCVLKAKVFVKDFPALSEEERDKMRTANPNCWQLK
jgi:hypothetical protein